MDLTGASASWSLMTLFEARAKGGKVWLREFGSRLFDGLRRGFRDGGESRRLRGGSRSQELGSGHRAEDVQLDLRRFVLGLLAGHRCLGTCPGRLRPAGFGARPSGLPRSAHRYRSSRSIGRGLTAGPARVVAGRAGGANDAVRIIVVTLPIGIDPKRSPGSIARKRPTRLAYACGGRVKGPQQLAGRAVRADDAGRLSRRNRRFGIPERRP